MSEKDTAQNMPDEVAAIVECGFATWAGHTVDEQLRARFDAGRIPVAGVRHVRVWVLEAGTGACMPLATGDEPPCKTRGRR